MLNRFGKSWRNIIICIGLIAIGFFAWQGWQKYNRFQESKKERERIESSNQKLEQVKSLVKERKIFEGVLVAIEATGESLDRDREVIEPIEESLQRSVPYLRERQRFPHDTTAYAFSPDKKHFVTGHEDGSIKFWLRDGTPTDKVIQTTKNNQESKILEIVFDADGKKLLVSNINQELQIWNVNNLTLSDSWSLGIYSTQLAISPDGETIVVAGGESSGKIGIWDSQGNVIKSPEPVHWVYIHDIAFTTDGQEFITSDSWGRVRHWDRTGQPLNQLEKDFKYPNFAVKFITEGGENFYLKVNLLLGLYKDSLSEELKSFGHTIGNLNQLYIPDKSDLNSNSNSFFSHKFISNRFQPWDANFSVDNQSEYFVVSYRDGLIQVYDEYAHPFMNLIEVEKEVYDPIFSGWHVAGYIRNNRKKQVRLWEPAPEGKLLYKLKEMEDWQSLLNHACQLLKSHSTLKNPTTETEKNAAKTCKVYGNVDS